MKSKIKLLTFLGITLLIILASYTLVYGYDESIYGAWGGEIKKSVDFEYIVTDDTITIIGVIDKNKKDIVIPDKIQNIPVTSIGINTFYGNKNIVNVKLPDTIIDINDFAFAECTNLKNITLSSNLESISVYAFKECSNLKSITLPNQMSYIDPYAFDNTITIKGYKNTFVWDFANNYGFNFVDLGTKKSGDFEYYLENNQAVISKCYTKKDNIIIFDKIDGYNVKRIGYQAMDYWEVKSITILDGIIEIDNYAFAHCPNLKSIIIPNSISEIGHSAFLNCSSLTSITIPDKVTKIAGSTFFNCSSLTNINMHKNVTYIGFDAFENCTSLKNITLPDNLKFLAPYAFNGCENLESVKIPNGIEELSVYTFGNCKKLKRIDIPSTVTYIDENTFKNVNNVTIYGYSGSEAEKFANKNKIPFVKIVLTGIKGDLNESGKIEANDAFIALQLSVSGKILTDKQLQLGDIDGNGKVDAFDAYQILAYSVGIKNATYWK